MRPVTRWILIIIAGIVLLVAPALFRTIQSTWNQPTYQPPVIATAAIAVTPIPTPTPVAIATPMAPPENRIRRGPVVVDLAHYSEIDRDRFQPLATTLSAQGIDLDFWLPTVDISSFRKVTDFPDLSKELAEKLNNASALVVVSPLFLYTPAEVAIVEKFVADGGRLLLISDPDIESDAAADTNQLATAFNIVFNEDYLYDTVDNDENYTYFFQGDYLNDAAALDGSRIAFYGGRSISGAMIPQVRSAATTLSSLRNGQTSFNTVVIGGQAANGSADRVLALSDFDVLTEPFVSRHDNKAILGFVSDFLAGAVRENTITDFPDFLGEDVALVLDNTEPFGAAAVAKTAELQRFVEDSGRTLYLAPASILSTTAPAAAAPMTASLIYIAGYRAAEDSTSILSDLGFELVEEVVTPTLSAPAVVTVSATPSTAVTNTTTTTVTITGNATPQPNAAATPQPVAASTAVTPVTTLYLERGDGVRLIAAETQLFALRPIAPAATALALIAGGEQAINAGVNRLLEHDYAGCIIQPDLMICPFEPERSDAPSKATPTASPPMAKPTETSATPAPSGTPTRPGDSSRILIVDDNVGAKEGEKSEAAIYLTVLTQAGYSPDLWVTGESGMPDIAELAPYSWVIWSDAGYASSGIDGDALRVISANITSGGHVTISSRMPFFGVGAQTPTPVHDVVVVDGVPELTAGLPKEPIALNEESPPLSPFDSAPEPSTGARMAMDRGPASGNPGAPILMVFSDESYIEPKGALLMLFGLSVGWLPNDVAAQLIENMADFMLKG